MATIGAPVVEHVERLFREEISMPPLIPELEITFFANSELRVGSETLLVMTPVHELHRPHTQISGIPVVVKVNAEIGLVQDHHFLHARTIYKHEVVVATDSPPVGQPKIESATYVGLVTVMPVKWGLVATLQIPGAS